MSYELFNKLATEVFGDAKMEAYYQAWKLSKTTEVCSLARSDTYADHYYGGGLKPNSSDHYYGGGSKPKSSLARSDTYADHYYGGGLKPGFATPTTFQAIFQTPTAPKKDPMDSNAKPNYEDDSMSRKLTF